MSLFSVSLIGDDKFLHFCQVAFIRISYYINLFNPILEGKFLENVVYFTKTSTTPHPKPGYIFEKIFFFELEFVNSLNGSSILMFHHLVLTFYLEGLYPGQRIFFLFFCTIKGLQLNSSFVITSAKHDFLSTQTKTTMGKITYSMIYDRDNSNMLMS